MVVIVVHPQPAALSPRLRQLEDGQAEEGEVGNLNQEKGQIEENKICQFFVFIKKAVLESELWLEVTLVRELKNCRDGGDDEGGARGVENVQCQFLLFFDGDGRIVSRPEMRDPKPLEYIEGHHIHPEKCV